METKDKEWLLEASSSNQLGAMAKMFCDILKPKGDPYATFMPEPLLGENGSGVHIHQSLFKSRVNAFFDSQEEYHLSKIARRYTARLIETCS